MGEHATQAEAIRQACSRHDMVLAHGLLVEYADWLQVDLCFQGFADELAGLPGAYAPPRGRLLLVGSFETAFGCIALRPLDTQPDCDGGSPAERLAGPVAEVKRLYIQPPYRQQGWGRRLVCAVLDEARAIGYRELRLDTFDWMTGARALYAGLGFRESAPYYHNPLAGAVYMSRTL
jgi:putative acetyltransferase